MGHQQHQSVRPRMQPLSAHTIKKTGRLHDFVVDCVPRKLQLYKPNRKMKLPDEVVALKHKILHHHRENHPGAQRVKSSRFSFSAMKRVFVPPVEIPKEMLKDKAVALLVAGKYVPFTREMFTKRKNLLRRTRMDPIDENRRMQFGQRRNSKRKNKPIG